MMLCPWAWWLEGRLSFSVPSGVYPGVHILSRQVHLMPHPSPILPLWPRPEVVEVAGAVHAWSRIKSGRDRPHVTRFWGRVVEMGHESRATPNDLENVPWGKGRIYTSG
jgi:hypothetical protein